MSTVIPIKGPRRPIEHDPMDDPATRVDHYVGEARRMLAAAEEALVQIEDPIERSYARTDLLELSVAAMEAVLEKLPRRAT